MTATQTIAKTAPGLVNLPEIDPFTLETKKLTFVLKGGVIVTQVVGLLEPKNDTLIVALEDVFNDKGEQIVWFGNVLNCNLELSKRLGLSPHGPLKAYQVYRDIYEFLRACFHINDWYDRVEVPFVNTASRAMQIQMHVCYRIGRGGLEAVEAHREAGSDVRVALQGNFRNEHKLAGQDKGVRGSVIENKNGIISPGRSKWLLGYGRFDIDERGQELGPIMISTTRRQAVAATLVGKVDAENSRFHDANAEHAERPDHEWTPEFREKTALRYDEYMARFTRIKISPWCRSMGNHQIEDAKKVLIALHKGSGEDIRAAFKKGVGAATYYNATQQSIENLMVVTLADERLVVPTPERKDELVQSYRMINKSLDGIGEDFTSQVVGPFKSGIDSIVECLEAEGGPHWDQARLIAKGMQKLR